MTRKMPSVPDPIFNIHSFEVEKKTLLICISDLVNMFDFLSIFSELLFPLTYFTFLIINFIKAQWKPKRIGGNSE